MSSGIDLISKERQEQIEKHGFSQEHDAKTNNNNTLTNAAAFLLTKNPYYFPSNWDEKWFKKMSAKKGIEALKVAGALIAAEIDRLQNENE